MMLARFLLYLPCLVYCYHYQQLLHTLHLTERIGTHQSSHDSHDSLGSHRGHGSHDSHRRHASHNSHRRYGSQRPGRTVHTLHGPVVGEKREEVDERVGELVRWTEYKVMIMYGI